MNKAEIFLLSLSTTIVIAVMSFSYVSLFFNIMKFIWILVHFTLVVNVTVLLLQRAEIQETKKEFAWITFGIIFLLTGIVGIYFFPTEEISRLFFIEPGMLIFSLLSIFSINKLKDNLLLNNKFLFYILVTLMLIFIIYSIFLPAVNSFFIEDVSYEREILKSEYANEGEIFIPISETTITNPTPIFLPVPVNQVYYCLYNSKDNPSYWNPNINFYSVQEAWFNVEGSDLVWKTYGILAEKSNRVVGDAAYTGYNFYQYTDKRPLIYKIPPFKTVIIKQAAKFDGINRVTVKLDPPIEIDGSKREYYSDSGYMLSDTNLIEIVERGKERQRGGSFPCQESKVISSVNLR